MQEYNIKTEKFIEEMSSVIEDQRYYTENLLTSIDESDIICNPNDNIGLLEEQYNQLETIKFKIEQYFDEDFCPFGDDEMIYDVVDFDFTPFHFKKFVDIVSDYYCYTHMINSYIETINREVSRNQNWLNLINNIDVN